MAGFVSGVVVARLRKVALRGVGSGQPYGITSGFLMRLVALKNDVCRRRLWAFTLRVIPAASPDASGNLAEFLCGIE